MGLNIYCSYIFIVSDSILSHKSEVFEGNMHNTLLERISGLVVLSWRVTVIKLW